MALLYLLDVFPQFFLATCNLQISLCCHCLGSNTIYRGGPARAAQEPLVGGVLMPHIPHRDGALWRGSSLWYTGKRGFVLFWNGWVDCLKEEKNGVLYVHKPILQWICLPWKCELCKGGVKIHMRVKFLGAKEYIRMIFSSLDRLPKELFHSDTQTQKVTQNHNIIRLCPQWFKKRRRRK